MRCPSVLEMRFQHRLNESVAEETDHIVHVGHEDVRALDEELIGRCNWQCNINSLNDDCAMENQ